MAEKYEHLNKPGLRQLMATIKGYTLDAIRKVQAKTDYAESVLSDCREIVRKHDAGELDGGVLFPSVRVDAAGYLIMDIPSDSDNTNLSIDKEGFLCVGYPDL